MAGQKPNEFPEIMSSGLTEDIEIYSQTGGVNNKFTIKSLDEWMAPLHNGKANTISANTSVLSDGTKRFTFDGLLFFTISNCSSIGFSNIGSIAVGSTDIDILSDTFRLIATTTFKIVTPDIATKSVGNVLMLKGAGLGDVEYEPIVSGGDTASRPILPYQYQIYFDTDLGVNGLPIIYNGSNWIDFSGNIV